MNPLVEHLDPNSPLSSLRRFPDGLHALEQALKPHLEIIRTIAKRFRTLDEGTFAYFFAQYYAQRRYRDTYIKVCPESERDFDEPFDTLDPYFKAWGEEDNPQVRPHSRPTRRTSPRLTSIYLPQYKVGEWDVLPYTPFSLDALSKSDRKRSSILERMLLTTDSTVEDVSKVRTLLSATLKHNVVHLNRLCSDLVALLAWYISKRGQDSLGRICETSRVLPLPTLLDAITPGLTNAFHMESEADARLAALWDTWLESVDSTEIPTYVPSHMLTCSMESRDWTADAIEAATHLVITVNALALRLTD